MRKYIFLILLYFAPVSSSATETKIIAAAPNSALFESTDEMTDEKTCQLWVDFSGSSRVLISYIKQKSMLGVTFSSKSNNKFAIDGSFYARVNKDAPIKLAILNRGSNQIYPVTEEDNQYLSESILKGQEIIFQFDMLEGDAVRTYTQKDKKTALGNIYNIASEKCGWPKLSLESNLPPAELRTSESSARVVDGDLSITKLSKDSCVLYGEREVLSGILQSHNKKLSMKTVSTAKVILRNQDGADLVLYENDNLQNNNSEAVKFASESWEAAPGGYILWNFMGGDITSASLYGFKELWDWGVKNCGFPELGLQGK